MNVAAKEGISPTTDCTITPSQWLMVSLPVQRSPGVDAVNLSCSPVCVLIQRSSVTRHVFLFVPSRVVCEGSTWNQT